jgi:hypothetical protein
MSDQINVPISPGELVDKITILEIKKEFIDDINKLKNIKHEYDLLMQIYSNDVSKTDGVDNLKSKLKNINASFNFVHTPSQNFCQHQNVATKTINIHTPYKR